MFRKKCRVKIRQKGTNDKFAVCEMLYIALQIKVRMLKANISPGNPVGKSHKKCCCHISGASSRVHCTVEI